MTEESGTWSVVITYDADNSYGASLRGRAVCKARLASATAVPVALDKISPTLLD